MRRIIIIFAAQAKYRIIFVELEKMAFVYYKKSILHSAPKIKVGNRRAVYWRKFFVIFTANIVK